MNRTRLYAVIAPLVLLLAACGINSVPAAEEEAKARWADVQNDYQRRADLIPNLVEIVKGAAAHERGTLEAVTEARESSRGEAASDSHRSYLFGVARVVMTPPA